MLLIFALFIVSCSQTLLLSVSNDGVVITSIANELTSTKNLLGLNSNVFFENKKSMTHKNLYFAVNQSMMKNLAFFSYKEEGGSEMIIKPSEAIEINEVKGSKFNDKLKEFKFFEIPLMQPLIPNMRVNVVFTQVFVNRVVPFPEKLNVAEFPNMMIDSNVYLDSIYHVLRQQTKFSCLKCKIGKHSEGPEVKVQLVNNQYLLYDNLNNVSPLSYFPITIQFNTVAPNIVNSLIHRKVLVSEYNEVEFIEKHIVENRANTVKGEFSRLLFQQNQHVMTHVVQSFKFVVPENAYNFYYRDDIGNISTSEIREEKSNKILIVSTRFPLLGGWNTEFTIKYKLSIEEFLKILGFHEDSLHSFELNLLGAMSDIQSVDSYILEVVFPEHSREIKSNKKDWKFDFVEKTVKTFYYLDVEGRPTLRYECSNLINVHEAKMKFSYIHEPSNLLWKPLYCSLLFLIAFITIIVASRIFSVNKNSSETDPNVLSFVEKINYIENIAGICLKHISKYANLISDYEADAFSADKKSADCELIMKEIENNIFLFKNIKMEISEVVPNFDSRMKAIFDYVCKILQDVKDYDFHVEKFKSGAMKSQEFNKKKAFYINTLRKLENFSLSDFTDDIKI